MPDHRYKGFHKSNYVEPSRANTNVNRVHYRHGLVQHFTEPGIEAKNEAEGLVYGSEKKYTLESQNKRLSFNEQLQRKQKQYKDLEDFMETHKQQKESMEANKAEQKRKDLEMLQKYQPWGRPAGGAPRVAGDGETDTRRKRLEWESQPNVDDDQSLQFGRPGGGAPRRTNSGTLQTSIVGDPATRFQRSCKQDVDRVLRYKSPQKAQEYAQSLGKQVLEQDPKERHSSPYQENDYHPYGKPGGGAPLQGNLVAATRRQFNSTEETEQDKKQKALRYARRLEQQRIEAITRKAKESDELKQLSSYDPWEKSHPMRDNSGNVTRHRQTLKHKMVADLDDSFNSTATPRARIPRTIGIHGDGSILDPTVNTSDGVFDPWGRPGAGAPIKNNSGQVMAATQNHFNDKKQAISNDTVVASPRNTSDVIVERLGIKRQVDANSYAYHSELERQAELRHQQKQREKVKEQRLALEHAARENRLWGCNANPDPIRRKLVDPTEAQSKKEKAATYHSELAELANQKYEEKKQQRDQNLIEDQKV